MEMMQEGKGCSMSSSMMSAKGKSEEKSRRTKIAPFQRVSLFISLTIPTRNYVRYALPSEPDIVICASYVLIQMQKQSLLGPAKSTRMPPRARSLEPCSFLALLYRANWGLSITLPVLFSSPFTQKAKKGIITSAGVSVIGFIPSREGGYRNSPLRMGRACTKALPEKCSIRALISSQPRPQSISNRRRKRPSESRYVQVTGTAGASPTGYMQSMHVPYCNTDDRYNCG
eukprot:scaffold5833_cov165-Amphora_coffeaeformis.AAC.26